MKQIVSTEGIDEKALLDSVYESSNGFSQYELNQMQDELRERNKQKKLREENAQVAPSEESVQTTLTETTAPSKQPENKRKHRKVSLEEFRQQFMHTPKIDDRKPIFISLSVRDSLDRIVRLFGERGLSVSGLMENLARNFLETYKDEVEQWRKM
jgi:hypothetical protein